ncbi:MAG TPA: cytochrome c oxidase subunit 3 family protein [Candidatus Sulfotelmatobacter sp.]|nr:cytochrome c oxidase subunit 3 family protein [Candidatus Sulfotelmatobacter sp.]
MSDSNVAVQTSVHEDVHRPELLHHFADPQQQRNSASLGMWIFLATEVMFFGGLFCAYLIYRNWYYADFAAASKSINAALGGTNTAVLICSSLTVVLAIWAAETSRRALMLAMLVLTMFFGLGFLGIKGVEYHDKFVEHHVPGPTFSFEHEQIPGHPGQYANPQHAEIFFALYFIMTGLHALHMIVGLGLFIWLFVMAWKGRFTPEYHTPLEIGGLYWHFVDIIWIYLFPLLYLIDRHP